MKTQFSLRKKIISLALLPALVACVIFAVLIAASSRRASWLVRENVTSFMTERTVRSLVHAYNTSVVTAGYYGDLVRLNSVLANLLVNSRGGIALVGSPRPVVLIGEADHVGGVTEMRTMHLAGSDLQGSRSEVVEEIARRTGALTIVFERLPSTGEMVRVAASSPRVRLGSFLRNTAQNGDIPPLETLTEGRAFDGRTLEADEWYLGQYTPLRDAGGTQIGALYIGLPVSGSTAFQQEILNNRIGKRGNVALVYAHGPQRGQMLGILDGVALETKSQWYPRVMAQSKDAKDGEEGAVNLEAPILGADAIVRYKYLERFDWMVIEIADSRDLQEAGFAVKSEFRALLLRSLIGAAAVLATIALIALLVSRRIIDPLLEITIQLTSNGTQVASSANQQLSQATSFNVSSTEVATAVKEISSTSQELLRAMEELSRDAGKASAVAEEGSSGLRGLSQSIEALSSAAHTIADSLHEIRLKANRINTVTLAVTKVADQTNLLSLNAAIEAERAGNAGAGFAVVAREIRRLADRSADSSQEIEHTIAEMQDAVTAGMEELGSLTRAVDQSVGVSEKIHQQFSEIIARVEAMTPRYEMVHLGMQNQSEGAQQISDAMWQLTETAGQTSEAIAELNQVSLELHEAVGLLKRRIFEGEAENDATAAVATA